MKHRGSRAAERTALPPLHDHLVFSLRCVRCLPRVLSIAIMYLVYVTRTPIAQHARCHTIAFLSPHPRVVVAVSPVFDEVKRTLQGLHLNARNVARHRARRRHASRVTHTKTPVFRVWRLIQHYYGCFLTCGNNRSDEWNWNPGATHRHNLGPSFAPKNTPRDACITRGKDFHTSALVLISRGSQIAGFQLFIVSADMIGARRSAQVRKRTNSHAFPRATGLGVWVIRIVWHVEIAKRALRDFNYK